MFHGCRWQTQWHPWYQLQPANHQPTRQDKVVSYINISDDV